MTITRRPVLLGTAAALGAGLLPGRARAQGAAELTVGTWGGDYGSLLKEAVDDTLMKGLGVAVTQQIAGNDPRRTKLVAEKTEASSSIDVAMLTRLDTYALDQQNVIADVQADAVPRLANVLPILRSPDAVPHIYSALVVVYNPAKISTPPKGYADLFDPAYAGRVGFSDILYNYNMAAANVVAGGSPTDFGPGRALLLDGKKRGSRVFPSTEALGAAFKNDEISIAPMWLARSYLWKKNEIPVAWSVPDEGAVPILFEAAVPRNAKNKDAAWKYLNALLDPGAQAAFAEKIGYIPTVEDAKLPEELEKLITLTDAQEAKLRPVDPAFMLAERGAILDFWNKEFKA